MAGTAAGSASQRSSVEDMMVESDYRTESSNDEDSQDTEDERLMTMAPTWQLHRLKKAELVRLNKLAGTWSEEARIDPEDCSKQQLVNSIIVCRSRLDKHNSPFSEASEMEPNDRFQTSNNLLVEDPDPLSDSGSASRNRKARRRGGAGRRSSTSASSESDRSHEAGGEETEAEPHKSAAAKKRSTRRAQVGGVLRRMDSSIFEDSQLTGEVEPSRRQSLPRRQLRTRSALVTLANERHAKRDGRRSIFGHTTGGSDAANASSSSLTFTSSGISPLGHHALRRRNGSRSNLFVASSPIRTRSRTRAQTGLGLRRKPLTRATAAAVQDMFGGDSMQTPRPGVGKRRNSGKMVAFTADDDLDQLSPSQASSSISKCRPMQRSDPFPATGDMEFDEIIRGDSRPKRQAKTRANRAIRQHELSDDDGDREPMTDSQLSTINDSDSETMGLSDQGEGMDEDDDDDEHKSAQPARAGARALRTRKASGSRARRASSASTTSNGHMRKQSTSASSLSSSSSPATTTANRVTAKNAADAISDQESNAADESEASSNWEPESPSKFRKLRNGKLRMPVRAEQRAGSPEVGETADDVHMDTAVENEMGSDAEGDDDRAQVKNEAKRVVETSHGEEIMTGPTAASLNRLRRAELVELCHARGIETSEEDKKADLIDALMKWFDEIETGDTTVGPDGDATDSDCSTATAKQTSRDDAPRTLKRKTGKQGSELTDSDRPLLERMHEGDALGSSKLLTPPLTSTNSGGRKAQTGDGVDELNGLDLESLNLVDKEIPPSKLEKLEKIGSGGFKDVYVGKYHISKSKVNKVAIADIRDQLTEMDIKELSLLRDLRHENIVRFIGVSIPEDPRSVPCMIVSELCSNGDLFDYIRNTSPPSDAEVFRIMLETARGLEYLHTRTPAIIHRDCKSTNVLITRNRTAKINDFGLARVKNTSRSMMRSLVGTVNWQAVELWVPKPHYNEKVDVWSAGMTFWETLQWYQGEKKYPFQGMNEHQIYQDVGQKRLRPYTGSIRRQFGGEIVDLLDRMWEHSPKERPTMTEVCEELERLIVMKKDKERRNKQEGRGKQKH